MRRAWQAAPVQTGLGLQTGALGGFGPEWEPTLHLNTVNTAKRGFRPPRGGEAGMEKRLGPCRCADTYR